MHKARITLIGERGVVSQMLQARIRQRENIQLSVLGTDTVLENGIPTSADEADLFVLATTDFASPKVVETLPEGARVLDISPAFRLDAGWVYGLPELPEAARHIASAARVANPGCFATSAILLLAPLVREGLISRNAPIYLDATGGYTTGGNALVQQAETGQLPMNATYSLTRKHRHVDEIQQLSGVSSPVWFTPEIGTYARGIRLQIPLFGMSREEVLRCYAASYRETAIKVHDETPSRLAGDIWAGLPGAGLWVIQQEQGIIAVSALDNLEKGAVASALRNIELMLALDTV